MLAKRTLAPVRGFVRNYSLYRTVSGIEVPKFKFSSEYDVLPENNTLSKQLSSYTNPKDSANLLKVVKQGKQIQKEHLQHTLKKLAEVDDAQEIKSLIGLWNEKGYSKTSVPYTFLIDTYLRSADSELGIFQVEELMKELKLQNIPIVQETYECLISGLINKNLNARALELVNEMRENNVKPSSELYTALFLNLTNSLHFHQARQVFDFIKQDLGTPSKTVYKILLTGSSHAGDVDSVQAILEEAGSDLELAAYLLDAHTQAKSDVSAIEKLKDQWKDHLTNKHIASGLLNYYASQNNLAESLKIFNSIKESGSIPEPYAYKKLLAHYTKKGDIKSALQLFEQLDKDGILDFEACALMGRLFASSGDSVSWFELLNGMANRGIPATIEAYHITIEALLITEQYDQATEALDIMVEDGFHPTSTTYHIFIKHYCAIGDMGQANHFFEKMSQNSIQPEDDIYLTLMLGYSRKGDMKAAAPLIKHLSSGTRLSDVLATLE